MTILTSLYHRLDSHGFEFDNVCVDLLGRWVGLGPRSMDHKDKNTPQVFEICKCCILLYINSNC